jgi:hypothetical protein
MKLYKNNEFVRQAAQWGTGEEIPGVKTNDRWVEDTCAFCKKLMGEHGVTDEGTLVCPEQWIVVLPQKGVLVVNNQEFKKRYTLVQDDN